MHTAVVGPPAKEVERLAAMSNAAIDTLLGAARAGRAARDVAREVQRSLRGVDDVLTAGMFGYAIGIAFPPTWREMINFVSLDDEEELEAGMTFHSPIPFRVPNRFGVGFSETWTVTEVGCEVLTKRDRSLYVAA
jgi:Xaa-Pro aminopeptidase